MRRWGQQSQELLLAEEEEDRVRLAEDPLLLVRQMELLRAEEQEERLQNETIKGNHHEWYEGDPRPFRCFLVRRF